MPTTTTMADDRQQPAGTALPPKKGMLSVRGARLMNWKSVLVESLGRELHTLHVQQQERAFMATTHGSIYASWRNDSTVVH